MRMEKEFWRDVLTVYAFAFLMIDGLFVGVFILALIVVGIGWLLAML